ncbi:peptidoglycan-binding domain-containing protein [Agaribacillus aureus]|uniref:peptidoglycan-binding domain-containing protein n=1 Tax=Agaribacillus aureus TaxID=3051825 RepID=UPI003D1BFE38
MKALDSENKNRIEFIQTKLKQLGYYNGGVDLFPGERTIEAIRKYQKNNQLNETGTWDLATLESLGYHPLGRSSGPVRVK